MPSLTNVVLSSGWTFRYKDDITITGSTHFIPLSPTDIGALQSFFVFNECWSDSPVSASITELVIGSYKCNAGSVTVFDLSKYPKLKSVTIGDGSFKYVNEVKMIGLSALESVEIGNDCFKNDNNLPNSNFHLKNCPKLKSLKIGRYSFPYYTVCEIENVNALETIEMSDENQLGSAFRYASLELKSILIHSE